MNMPAWEIFPKPPIVEALLDIRASFVSLVDPADLEAFHNAIREQYPIKQDRVRWGGQIRVGEREVEQAVRRESQGFMFKSGDTRRVVQARQDGFTFNWLKPYSSWEAFRSEAQRHWQRYRGTFRPEAVTRLGLQYINRLELPLPFHDFRDFITTVPDVARGIPQGLGTFFMRLAIPHPTRTLLAIITETMEAPVEEGAKLPVLLDIDIVRQERFEPDSDAIWDTFEQMREYKNEIFFASITDKAKEMFR